MIIIVHINRSLVSMSLIDQRVCELKTDTFFVQFYRYNSIRKKEEEDQI